MQLEAHIIICPECREEVEFFRTFNNALSDTEVPGLIDTPTNLCPNETDLVRYTYGSLDLLTQRHIRAHLVSCDSCFEDLEILSAAIKPPAHPDGLTPREVDILELLAQGFSNAAIAEHLNLTERTVEAYISTIYQRLDISSEREVHARIRATLIYLRDSREGLIGVWGKGVLGSQSE